MVYAMPTIKKTMKYVVMMMIAGSIGGGSYMATQHRLDREFHKIERELKYDPPQEDVFVFAYKTDNVK